MPSRRSTVLHHHYAFDNTGPRSACKRFCGAGAMRALLSAQGPPAGVARGGPGAIRCAACAPLRHASPVPVLMPAGRATRWLRRCRPGSPRAAGARWAAELHESATSSATSGSPCHPPTPTSRPACRSAGVWRRAIGGRGWRPRPRANACASRSRSSVCVRESASRCRPLCAHAQSWGELACATMPTGDLPQPRLASEHP